MMHELKVPAVGESITEVQVLQWLKAEGDAVALDEPVVVLETDKATVEVPAPAAGVLARIDVQAGATARIGDVLGGIEAGATAKAAPAKGKTEPTPAIAQAAPEPVQAPAPAPATVPPPRPADSGAASATPRVMPAARRAAAQQGVDLDAVTPTGPGGRVLKEDVLRAASEGPAAGGGAAPTPAPAAAPLAGHRVDETVPMTRIRKVIAARLVEAQHQAALLTTFNEIDMGAWMDLRKRRQEAFVARHGVKLGLTAIFVKAVVEALREVPQLNAEVRGDDIVYHRYFDIGIAVGGGRGLVVPVLRDADRLSFAGIEQAVADFGARARDNKIDLAELAGGTFTITNGGVYGSLLSTPIVNPPQSGVLGLHGIQDRPVARDGQVVIRPMMYVALTYDHRIVDGREAVTFLKRVKDLVEDPALLLLET